ncbi:MAG: type VI secretion system tube protein Hcp [Pseudomonadota bacterium]|nr:type VI secretion system tube protein Hcp [Pseudomonadota bacterium]
MNKPASTVASGSDMFLGVQTKRAGKVKGEATADGHADDIEVRSITWGVSSPTAVGSTAATGRRQYKHLLIVKGIDSASTGLLSALVTNDEVKEAKLTLRKAGGDALDYYVMTLAQARVVAIDLGVDDQGRPTETVSFAYAKIDIEYKRQQGVGISGASTSFSDEVMAK